jgi:hypothetical protein
MNYIEYTQKPTRNGEHMVHHSKFIHDFINQELERKTQKINKHSNGKTRQHNKPLPSCHQQN